MVQLVVASEIEASLGVVLVEGLGGIVDYSVYVFYFVIGLVIDSCVYRVVVGTLRLVDVGVQRVISC